MRAGALGELGLALCSVIAAVAALGGCRHLGLQPHPLRIDHEEVTTSTGVRWEDLFRGKGPAAQSGDELLLDYTLWLEDGKRVDSTLDRGLPITTRIGATFVPGLSDGLIGIQPDGQRRIVVPPKLGYGDKGVEGLIPPNATLVFEVHAIEVHVHAGK